MKLAGVKVLDLSLFLPGPHLSMMMGDHGADVIAIEPPGGEPNRRIGLSKDGHSVWFRNTHRGKRSLCLDLKKAEATEVLLRLCEQADVLIEAFRPGVVKRLGIDYETIKKRAPHLIYCSISAYGQFGPKHLKPAHDLSVQADSGLLSINLDANNYPAQPHMPVADMASSLMALSGILMALYRRTRTKQGDYLDISMQDAVIAWLPNALGPVFAEQRPPVPRHERSWGGAALYQIYATADNRHLVLGGSEIKFAENLLKALGREDLIPLCAEPPGPVQAPVRAFLREHFASQPLAHWNEWFADLNVCYAPVRDLHSALHDEHLQAREMLLVDDNGNEHLGVPIRFSEEPAVPDFSLPETGEHGRQILAEINYSQAAIADLIGAQAVLEKQSQ